jgi:hypothetical protein
MRRSERRGKTKRPARGARLPCPRPPCELCLRTPAASRPCACAPTLGVRSSSSPCCSWRSTSATGRTATTGRPTRAHASASPGPAGIPREEKEEVVPCSRRFIPPQSTCHSVGRSCLACLAFLPRWKKRIEPSEGHGGALASQRLMSRTQAQGGITCRSNPRRALSPASEGYDATSPSHAHSGGPRVDIDFQRVARRGVTKEPSASS